MAGVNAELAALRRRVEELEATPRPANGEAYTFPTRKRAQRRGPEPPAPGAAPAPPVVPCERLGREGVGAPFGPGRLAADGPARGGCRGARARKGVP